MERLQNADSSFRSVYPSRIAVTEPIMIPLEVMHALDRIIRPKDSRERREFLPIDFAKTARYPLHGMYYV